MADDPRLDFVRVHGLWHGGESLSDHLPEPPRMAEKRVEAGRD